MGEGLAYSVTNPGDFLYEVADIETWRSDPMRALGHLVPGLVLTFATAGTGTAATAAARAAEAAALAAATATLGTGATEAGQNNGTDTPDGALPAWLQAIEGEASRGFCRPHVVSAAGRVAGLRR